MDMNLTRSEIRAAWTRIQLRHAHPTGEVRRRLADARKRAEQSARRAA